MASVTTGPPAETARVFFDGDSQPDGSSGLFVRLRRARLGMLVALTAIVMIFVSYSSAYVVRQGLPTLDPRTGTLVHDWLPLQLPNLLLLNTIVLLVSTLTMELARRQSLREAIVAAKSIFHAHAATAKNAERLPWLAFTAILGLAFLLGQWVVWRDLAAHGVYVATSPSSSFFYLLTGMHGIHLLGGVLALFAAGAISLGRRGSAEFRSVLVDATAWYWHFLTFLWIYLLCLLEFAR